ncbi:MAG: T9SS type A sorting domain-containing protein [Saprospiraceae bacterium]
MKKNLYSNLFILLFIMFFQGHLFSQCNDVTLTSLNLTSTTNNGDGTCSYALSVSLTVEPANGMGGASACIEYTTLTGPGTICYDQGTTLVNEPVTIIAACELPINLVGHASTGGTGTACNGALQIPSPPLPVELVRFDAYLDQDKVVIEWLTATEENNDYFEVQHSSDGRNFQPLAKVRGMGTTDLTQHYQYVDTKPSRGNNYYRLKQVDFDGKFEILDINVVKLQSLDAVSVYPSQVFDVITLELSEVSSEDIDIEIFSSAGILMKKGVLKTNEYKISFEVSELPSGPYFIRYVNEDFEYSSKQFFKMLD